MTSPGLNHRTFVIANPAAGAGSVGDDWPLIERLLRANLPELDFAFTEGPGHATLLTREALRAGWEMIVCVGGDGTLNEVLNGFFETPDPSEHFQHEDNGWITYCGVDPTPVNPDAVLGILPLGTGGDYRRSLGLMGGIAENIEHLRGRHTRSIDIGQLGYLDHQGELASRFFINISCAGMSGLVDRYANSTWKGLGGTMSFVIATVRAFLHWQNAEVEVRLDDTTEIQGHFVDVIAALGEYFGGGMWIAPGADLDDGAFQVVTMGNLTKSEMLKIFPQIYQGKHVGSRKVSRYRAQQVAVRPVDDEREVLIDCDGEQPGRLPALWKLHPGAIQVKI